MSEAELSSGHPRRLNRRAWNQRHQLSEVPSVKGEFVDKTLVDHFSEYVAVLLHEWSCRCHRELFLAFLDQREIEVSGGIESDIDQHILRNGRKSRRLCADPVDARGDFRDDIGAVAACHCVSRQPGRAALGRNLGASY